MSDIRVNTTVCQCPKVLKIMRKLGDRSFFCLIRLWSYVATSRPLGRLDGMDVDDIELAADWQGTPGTLLSEMVNLRLLDLDGEVYCVHDWAEHQGWIVGSQARSEKARKAASARWTHAECSEHATSMPDAMPLSSPLPSPPKEEEKNILVASATVTPISPSATEKKPKTKTARFVPPTVGEVAAYCRAQGFMHVEADYFWNYYESIGWMRGSGTPMVNWKATVRTWERNGASGAAGRYASEAERLHRDPHAEAI